MITGRPRPCAGGSEAEKVLGLFHQAERPRPAASPGQRASVSHKGAPGTSSDSGMWYAVPSERGVTPPGLCQEVQKGEEPQLYCHVREPHLLLGLGGRDLP